jgi:dihydrofolate reductase
MRSVIFGAATSLDNFIARADHRVDWLHWSADVAAITNAAGFLERLKHQEGKAICVMGGGELANALFTADLIDEVGLNIHPIILGNGIPMFLQMQREIRLELTESRILEGGCVLVYYRVLRQD